MSHSHDRDPASAPGPARVWLAHPWLSVILAAVWLLLQQSVSVPNLLTAGVLALVIPRLFDGFLGEPTRPRAVGTVVRLGCIVVWDIIMSNLTVARLVLNPKARPRPMWVEVPIDAQHPTAITLLASVITLTPGTVSCVVDEQRRRIWVHALDCEDAAEMAAQIKARYERPLMEILG